MSEAGANATPLPVRVAGVALAVGATIAALWAATGQRGVEVVAYNGHPRAVHAVVGPWEGILDPGSAAPVEGVRPGVVSIAVSTLDGETIEAGQLSIDDPGDGVAILNLNRRGVLARRTLRYIGDDAVPRPSDPPPPVLLGNDAVVITPPADHLFEPPASIDVPREVRFIDEVAVVDLGRELPLDQQVAIVDELAGPPAVRALLTAALEAEPADAAALAAARVVWADDPDGRARLAAELRRKRPEAVEVHRFYQDVAGRDPAALLEEYAQLAAGDPASGAFAYLHGRLLPLDDPAAEAAFTRAVDLDPDLRVAHLALGNIALLRGEGDVAARHLSAHAQSGAVQAGTVLGDRLRALRLSGHAAWSPAVQGVLVDSRERGVPPAQLLVVELRLRAAGTPQPLGELIALGDGILYGQAGGEPDAGVAARWRLALARGDAAAASTLLGLAPAGSVHPDVVEARFLQALWSGDAAAADAVVMEHPDLLAAGGLTRALLPAAWARARGLPVAADLEAACTRQGGSASPAWVLSGADPRTDPRAAKVLPRLRPLLWAAHALLASELTSWEEARRWALPGELPPTLGAPR